MDYCQTCVYYPPSSCDGKPCTQCDITNPFLTCYREKEFVVDFFQQEHKPTNADRIRSMADEELASFLYKFHDCPCFGVKFCEIGTSCEDAVLMKLREAVDNGACFVVEISEKVKGE